MPRQPSPVAEVLADLSRALTSLGAGWYLFGAQAAIVHGVTRFTHDVDVTVELGAGVSRIALVGQLRTCGIDLQFGDAAFIQQTHVLPCVHRSTRHVIDLVLAGSGYEQQCLARAVVHDIGGTPVPVATAEDIIVLKILAGRDKDNRDVETIVAVNPGDLDRAYIERTLRALEQALDQSDLIPTLDTLWKKATRLRLE